MDRVGVMTHEALLASRTIFRLLSNACEIVITSATARAEISYGAERHMSRFHALCWSTLVPIQILHDLLPAVPSYKSAAVLEEGVFLAPLCRTPLTPVAWICNSVRAFLCSPKLSTNASVVAILRDLAVDSLPLGRYARSGGG